MSFDEEWAATKVSMRLNQAPGVGWQLGGRSECEP